MSCEGWKTYKIEDVCLKICSGGTPKSTERSYYDGEIPWLNTKEIDFNRIYDTERKITEQGFSNSSTQWIEPNSVIVAMYGATAGKICVNKIPLTTNQACCNLTIDEQRSDYRFVYYYLCNNNVELAGLANGGAQQNLNAKSIKDFPINLPPLGKQKIIADFLSSLDDKIELNNQINANLEQQAQAIFKSWFIDFDPLKGGIFFESELGLIPKGWKVGKFSDIGDIIGGSTPSKSNDSYFTNKGVHWITPKDLSNNKNKFIAKGEIDITTEGLKNSSAKLMPKGSVLYSSRAPIGYIAIAKNDLCTNQGFKSVVPYQNIGTAFIYYYLKEKTLDIKSQASGSTFKEVSGSFMKNYQVIIPDATTLTQFNSICSGFFSQQEKNEEENIQLSKLRDFLLPRFMSGEIEI